ncbi:hypothetical protein F4861DRAFT_538215 [Xylaria intraflava]|nr:hypothetical protein F4861DRAFT_538215 [Xylaria intraflava]
MDYYNILNVSPDAEVAAIEKAFKLMSLKHHPDKANASTRPSGPESESQREAREKRNNERYVEIVTAREVLTDPARRREYDQERAGKGKSAKSADDRRYSTAGGDYHQSRTRTPRGERKGKSSKPTGGDYYESHTRTSRSDRKGRSSRSAANEDPREPRTRTRTPHGEKRRKSPKPTGSRRHSTVDSNHYDFYPRTPRESRRAHAYDEEDDPYDSDDCDHAEGTPDYEEQYDQGDYFSRRRHDNAPPYPCGDNYEYTYRASPNPSRHAPQRPSYPPRRASFAHAPPRGSLLADTAITASMAELALESMRLGTIDCDAQRAQSLMRRAAQVLPVAQAEAIMALLGRARARNQRCRGEIAAAKEELEDLRTARMDHGDKYRLQQEISDDAVGRAQRFVRRAGPLVSEVLLASEQLLRAGRWPPRELPSRICFLLDRYPRA